MKYNLFITLILEFFKCYDNLIPNQSDFYFFENSCTDFYETIFATMTLKSLELAFIKQM